MIQNIAPYEYHNEYINRCPKDSDTVFVFRGRSVLAAGSSEEGFRFPVLSDIPEESRSEARLYYLFRISERFYYILLPDDHAKPIESAAGPSYSFIPLMEIRSREHTASAFAALTAFHLYTWYDKNRFCGRCGSGARLEHSDKERMLRCPECGNMVFPTIAPAVIVGVTNGEDLLMTKYAGREYGGWALIAGFCEIGEEVEDTVHREVMEEAGIRIKNLRYVASQPWGSDSNLLMGFFCDVDGDADIHMDEDELSRAVWVNRGDVPDMGDNLSLTGHLIELFRTGKA